MTIISIINNAVLDLCTLTICRGVEDNGAAPCLRTESAVDCVALAGAPRLLEASEAERHRL